MSKFSDFMAFAKERRTCFEFSNRVVKDEDILKMIDVARWAPSCTNSQPWHFVIIRDKKQIEKAMKTANYGFFHEYPNVVIACVLLRDKCVGPGYACFRGVDSAVHDTFMSVGCAALNICYEAQDLGIQSAIITPDKKINKILKIKSGDVVPLLVCVGYEPEGSYKRKRVRNYMADIVSYETFGGRQQ